MKESRSDPNAKNLYNNGTQYFSHENFDRKMASKHLDKMTECVGNILYDLMTTKYPRSQRCVLPLQTEYRAYKLVTQLMIYEFTLMVAPSLIQIDPLALFMLSGGGQFQTWLMPENYLTTWYNYYNDLGLRRDDLFSSVYKNDVRYQNLNKMYKSFRCCMKIDQLYSHKKESFKKSFEKNWEDEVPEEFKKDFAKRDRVKKLM